MDAEEECELDLEKEVSAPVDEEMEENPSTTKKVLYVSSDVEDVEDGLDGKSVKEVFSQVPDVVAESKV